MELIKDLTGSLLWATLLSIALYAAGSIAIDLLAKKSTLLKPIASGLKLIALFVAIQVFLHLGAAEYHPGDFAPARLLLLAGVHLCRARLGLVHVRRPFRGPVEEGELPGGVQEHHHGLILVVVALILLKEILDINVTSLIATTTVLTATIGLAFQSTLANMLAGLTIHLEKPLKQGDWISAGGHEGHVMDITLRSTRIMTVEHNEVFIPNSKVLSEAVVNYSLPDTLQMRTLSVGVNYDVPPNKVKGVILDVLASVSGVNKQPAPVVQVVDYGDFSVKYKIRFTISDFSRHGDIDAEIMNLMWYRLKRSGIDIPMPVRDIRLREITTESLRSEQEQRTDEILRMMEKVEIFSPLSDEELRKLVRQVQGRDLCSEGNPRESRVTTAIRSTSSKPATLMLSWKNLPVNPRLWRPCTRVISSAR